MRQIKMLLVSGLIAVGASCGSTAPAPVSTVSAAGGGDNFIFPDFRPWWGPGSVDDIAVTTGLARDRLVSCEDWTLVDPSPPTGRRVLSFQLWSPNFGQGDMRLRRQTMPDGSVQFFQRFWRVNANGSCEAVETDFPIATRPTGTDQSSRWLPLAKFALYTIADNGGIGDRVACQIKRWCCLSSVPRCATRGTCPTLPTSGTSDSIEAGAYDGYPFHWTDQFLLIEGLPSGEYWFEDEINPGTMIYESDYTNNSMFFKIYIDQEAGTARVTQPPDGSFMQCPG